MRRRPLPKACSSKSHTHPRAYGNFANLLGNYVREEHVISLQEAVRRMTSYAASDLGITDRGSLSPGAYADIVVFDPQTIAARATYEQPHQYAAGGIPVFVNGVPVLQ